MSEAIVFDNVSKFYGEVLGVNQVNLKIPKGITGLVGPNGSGKSTLMNLVTGLLKPSDGEIRILDLPPNRPERLFSEIGYCTQYDSFPHGMTGYEFIYGFLRVHGFRHDEADELTWRALDRVKLTDAAHRKAAGYSKGMRQRVRVAQAISHEPRVLVLDEPLNGLDPMARAEVTSVFQEFASDGHVLISSHILHEIDMFSDQVVLLSGGYVVAEGDIHGVRTEMEEGVSEPAEPVAEAQEKGPAEKPPPRAAHRHQRPIQILVRCDRPGFVAQRLFQNEVAVEVSLLDDGDGLLARTRAASDFYRLLNDLVVADGVTIDTVSSADADVRAVYQYLIGDEREAR